MKSGRPRCTTARSALQVSDRGVVVARAAQGRLMAVQRVPRAVLAVLAVLAGRAEAVDLSQGFHLGNRWPTRLLPS